MQEQEFDKNLKKAITAEERKIQKEYLRSIETSLNISKKKFNWRIAATITIIIGLSGYFLLFNKSLSNDELFSTYFSPYENVVAPIVRDQITLSKKAQAFRLYEQEDYIKAIDGFNELTALDSIDVSTINFYKANAYLELKKYENAKDFFSQASQNKEWKNESFWYLALISIKLNDKDSALNYLKKLENQSYKRKEVEDLMNILN